MPKRGWVALAVGGHVGARVEGVEDRGRWVACSPCGVGLKGEGASRHIPKVHSEGH